ncbi:MAG: SGNH/GDSL hydrolase family protein [Pyrinomonadaceae bacterium]|nr:SGNH/GDSL hydrolase family protein [Pyrinomonadaceae bacterium]
MIQPPRRSRRILGKLLLVLIGFFFGGVVAEIALRLVGYSYPEFYTVDQLRGYALRPGAEGWYRKEGEAYIRINSDGLRDREHSTTKPPNTIRIAVLGDSYPEALSVSQEEAFWSVMEGRLQECGAFAGKRVEVLNFGVSGYGTAQELLTLRDDVWKYSPDVVMLAMTTNNDIADNSRALKKTDEIPYFVYRDNQLTLDDSFKTSRSFVWRQSAISGAGRWLRDHSRFVQAIIQGHHALKIRLASWRAVESPNAKPEPSPPVAQEQATQRQDQLSSSDELGIDNLIYLEPGNAEWNNAWRVTEGLITLMHDEVKTRGAQFVVVTLSNGIQVVPNPHVREAFEKRLGITDIFSPDNRIKSACTREGIPVITLAPELQKSAVSSNTFLHGFGENIGNGHWNPAGHRKAGELIAKKLCEDVLSK